MTITTARRCWSLAILAALAFLTAGHLSAAAGPEAPGDEGYFLTAMQKGQLIWWGRIRDSAGRWYDVWICPGYTGPASYAWEHVRKSGEHFHRYVEPAKYRSLAEHSGDCFEWAFQDCIRDFVVEGVPAAWGRYMDHAAERTRRRVFGSIVSYPWAVMEGVFDTTFRVTGGLCGMLLGTTTGATIVPVWNAFDSGVAGTAVFVSQGIVLPVCGWAWNTVASPVLATVGGPQPAPSRVDGFWVRRVDASGRARTELSSGELSAAVAWGVLMLTEVQPSLERSAALAKETEAKIAALRQDMTREQQRLRDEADRRASQLRDASDHPVTSPATLNRHAGQIEKALNKDGRISPDDVRTIMELLRRYPPPLPPPPPAGLEKTDPVRRGVEILEDVTR